jgi:hypothetical protein
MEEKQNIHILKYYGNNNFFAALCKNKDDYYILIAKTYGIDILTDRDIERCLNKNNICLAHIVTSYRAKAEIDFKTVEDNTLFKLIKIKDEDEFDHLVKALECIL